MLRTAVDDLMTSPPLGGLVAAAPARRVTRGDPFRYVLLLRFTLINVAGFAFVGVAWLQGWLAQVAAADTTHICKLIAVVFLFGLVQSGRRVLQLTQELNDLRDPALASGSTRTTQYLRDIRGLDSAARQTLAGVVRMKLAHRIAPIRHIASTLVLLGLVGTIVGFVVALSGVDADTVSDPSAIGPTVATLLLGISMALFKTLVGSVLNIWLMIDYRLLESGAVHVIGRMIEAGERLDRA